MKSGRYYVRKISGNHEILGQISFFYDYILFSLNLRIIICLDMASDRGEAWVEERFYEGTRIAYS